MITVIKILQPITQAYDDSHKTKVVARLAGLSTDEKPLGYANGSELLLMDTSKWQKFDEDSLTWNNWEGPIND